MLNVKKLVEDNKLLLSLRGDMTEDSKSVFDEILADLDYDGVLLDLAKVDLINSMGCREWLVFFSALKKTAANLVLRRCSRGFVEACNLLPAFANPKYIESVLLPITCQPCQVDDFVLALVKDFKASRDIELGFCKKCQNPMTVNVDLDDYFLFLG